MSQDPESIMSSLKGILFSCSCRLKFWEPDPESNPVSSWITVPAGPSLGRSPIQVRWHWLARSGALKTGMETPVKEAINSHNPLCGLAGEPGKPVVCYSVQLWGPEILGRCWCKFPSESESSRTRSANALWMLQLKQRERICSSSAFLFNLGPEWIGCSPTLGMVICFT